MKLDAVIFDFDDTLVASNSLFEAAREEIFAAMREHNLTGEENWAEHLNQADIANVRKAGYFAANCFPDAMRDTYIHFAGLSGVEPDMQLAQRLETAGWNVYEAEAAQIEGAMELLSALHGRVRLFLLTQGVPEIQQKRLEASGLLPFFTDYAIVRHKDVAAFRELVAKHNIDVAHSWMIGNSMRSDINPALEAGLNAAHFQISAWEYEHVTARGGHAVLHQLIDFLELIKDDNQGGGNPV